MIKHKININGFNILITENLNEVSSDIFKSHLWINNKTVMKNHTTTYEYLKVGDFVTEEAINIIVNKK